MVFRNFPHIELASQSVLPYNSITGANKLYTRGNTLYMLDDAGIERAVDSDKDIVPVRVESDFGTADAGIITLVGGTTYIIHGNVICSNTLRVPDGASVNFWGHSAVFDNLIYVGSGLFIDCPDLTRLHTFNLGIFGNPAPPAITSGTILISADSIQVRSSVFFNFCGFQSWDSLGNISNLQTLLYKTNDFADFNEGFHFVNCTDTSITAGRTFHTGDPTGTTFFNFDSGNFNQIFMNAQVTVPGIGGAGIYISPTATVGAAVFTANPYASALGGDFFDFGSTGAITAFADAGGGKTTVTSANHNIPDGRGLIIAETTNYNGAFNIESPATNTYVIDTAFVADDAAGIWNSAGLDETDIRMTAFSNGTQADSAVIGSLQFTGNEDVTEISIQGTNNIIISIADAGGGDITVTLSTSHGRSNGDLVVIPNTTNYKGSYIISNATGSVFDITATFVATDIGTVEWGWEDVIGTATSGEPIERFTLSTVPNELTYIGREDIKGLAHIDVTATDGSSGKIFEIMLFRKSVGETYKQIIDSKKTGEFDNRAKGLGYTAATLLLEGDSFKLMVRNIEGIDNILIIDSRINIVD